MIEKMLKFFKSHALLVSIMLFTAMTIVRLTHFLVTAYSTSDESLYMWSGFASVEKGTIIILYQQRFVYQLIIAVFSLIFRIDNIWKMATMLSFINLFCTSLTAYLLQRTLKRFYPQWSSWKYTLLLPTIIMLAVGNVIYTTEAVSLMFLVSGFYLLCEVFHSKRYVTTALSGILFGLAYLVREPYVAVAVIVPSYLTYLTIKKRFPFKLLMVFILSEFLLFRIPNFENNSVNLGNFVFVELYNRVGEGINSVFTFMSIEPIVIQSSNVVLRSGGYIPESNITAFEQTPMQIYSPSAYGVDSWVNGVLPSLDRIYYSTIYVVIGCFIGWNPIFFVLTITGLYLLIKSRKQNRVLTNLLLVTSIGAVFTFMGSSYLVSVPNELQISSGLELPVATIIRLSHTSLFATVLSIPVMEKIVPMLKKKTLIILAVVCVAIVGGTFGYSLLGLQSNFSSGFINRVDFTYRAPYLRTYDYTANTGKTLLFGGHNVISLSLFIRLRDNVFVSRPVDEIEFHQLLNGDNWDTILAYGVTHFLADPALEERFPFYWSLVHNMTEYKITEVFKDGESYLYQIEIK